MQISQQKRSQNHAVKKIGWLPKEGERVAPRHFHERVGESPRREKNFGTSGYKLCHFVSEIWPFEVGIAVRPNFT